MRRQLASAVVAVALGVLVGRRQRRWTPSHDPFPPAGLPAGTAADVDQAYNDGAHVPTDGAPASSPVPAPPRPSRVRALARAVTLLALVALAAVTLPALGVGTPDQPRALPAVAATAPQIQGPPQGPNAVDPPRSSPSVGSGSTLRATTPDQRAAPATITIPAIGVEASVIPLEVDDGALEVPEDFAQTGWWRAGPEPGEVGPAVIVGHVDSYEGPAVFFRLGELVRGDRIEVIRTDGSTATFAVTGSREVRKDDFPTDDVYGSTDESVLRLITCDGDFADGSYLGNLIVNAELVDETDPPTVGALR